MARPKSPHPTELELQILKILWDRSPLPVREIRLALADGGRELAHTSVITTLGVMVRKKYLNQTKRGNAFLFTPKITREEVSGGMLGDIVSRVFDGSPTALMARAATSLEGASNTPTKYLPSARTPTHSPFPSCANPSGSASGR